jgi:hypothetical protein
LTIADLGQSLCVINPYDGWNPLGNCMNCAVETALTLALGRDPQPVDQGDCTIKGKGGQKDAKFPDDTENRAEAVWEFLTIKAVREGVYAVDAEDHAYNFLIDENGQPYLIDSNQQLFLKLASVEDLKQQVRNKKGDKPIDYHYADPPAAEDGSDMIFYFFGRIAKRWALLLAQ